MKHRVTCHCEQSVEFEVPDSIDASPDSADRVSIRDGSFLTIRCENCGERLRPEVGLVVRDGVSTVAMVPEIERNRFLLGKVDVADDASVVIGFRELRERIIIEDDSLDPATIEMLKYQILRRAGAGAMIRILYESMEDDELVFQIHGLKDDEIALMKVPRRAYDRARDELRSAKNSEPYATILQGPYVSINKIEIEPETENA